MELKVRRLLKTDYEEYLSKWWVDWNWTAPLRDFLPDEGTGGLMVLANDMPVCAGFIYTTNSSVAWVDWIISSRTFKEKPHRQKALSLLIESLTATVKHSGHGYSYALIKNKSLIKTYEEAGYTLTATYNTEMIKKL